MCIRAIEWASSLTIKPSSLKFVLIALASFADNKEGKAWPSFSKILSFTSQDTKTVTQAIAELQRRGYITDTGARMGSTNSVKVFLLNAEIYGRKITPQEPPETEALPKKKPLRISQEATPFFPESPTENGESPTPPIKKGTVTNRQEPSIKKNKSKKDKIALLEWEEQVGSKIRAEMMTDWAKENKLDLAALPPLIADFRERVQISDFRAVNFIAAFQNWLRRGFFGVTMDQLKIKAIAQKESVSFAGKGLSL